MAKRPPIFQGKNQTGMTLVEFLVASAIGIFVLAAIGQAFITSKISQQLNQGLALVQQNGRFAITLLEQNIRMAGFQDRDITAGPLYNALSATSNGNDTLTLAFGTGNQPTLANCLGQTAPQNDVMYVSFSLSDSGELLCSSHFERSNETQQSAIVSGIETLQVVFGEDTNRDGVADRYIRAADVTDMQNVTTVRVCLVASSVDLTDTQIHSHTDCSGNEVLTQDGKLRRSFATTILLRNRA